MMAMQLAGSWAQLLELLGWLGVGNRKRAVV